MSIGIVCNLSLCIFCILSISITDVNLSVQLLSVYKTFLLSVSEYSWCMSFHH